MRRRRGNPVVATDSAPDQSRRSPMFAADLLAAMVNDQAAREAA
jgi:hypothetical protein